MIKEQEDKQIENKIPLPECGYRLGAIYFYLTEGCNLKCRHCWIAPKFQTEDSIWPSLDFDLFKDIIKQGKELGLSVVKLTGGEPLIHPDIEKILDHIKEQDLRLTIETNGVKCTPAIVEKIIKCDRPSVFVSIDGVDAETHEWVRGVTGSFDAAWEGVRNLVNAGLRPQIIMSVMKHNVDQMEAVVRLAEKENAESVKFNIVTPTARGEQMEAAGETLPIKELIELGTWFENKLDASTKLRAFYSHPTAFRPLNKLYTKSGGQCGIFSIMGVLGSGKYALCGIGETTPELVFGDATKDKLVDVWNNNKILQDIRRGLPKELKGICGDCLMKNNCLASCIAMNYYKHKDLFAPHWYCEEAHKIGLFPKTRIKPGTKSEYKTEAVSLKN
jgi:SynChlorMet cassette radical SAM/SPASM protein ScmF